MKEKTIRNTFTAIRVFLAALLLFLCICVGGNIYATERRVVKVAFFPMDGYHTVNEDGTFGGMDVEYLDALSDYVNWNIQYVKCDSWEDALEMLKNEEVDLVGSAQYSAERAEIYQYADLSSGYTFGVIATNADGKIAYEDFRAMAELNFGMVENYVRKNEFLEYLSHNGIENPVITEYKSTADMQAALSAGEIDAFVHTFTEVKEGQRLIGRFAPRPFYYITYKGNDELLRELNQAIVDLTISQPELETELMNKFYYNKFDKEVILTTDEKSYLEEKGTLVVGYLDNFYPFSYVRDEQFKGLTRELLESELSITGLQLEYRLFSNRQEAREAVADGTIDIFAYSTDQDIVLEENGLKSICDYAEVPLVLVMEKNRGIDEIATLATVSFLEEKAKNAALAGDVEIITFDTQQECIDAVVAGDVDAVFCDGYLVEHLMRTNYEYGNLQIKTVVSGKYSISIAVRKNAEVLQGILEKTIPEIDSKMINEYMLRENTYPLVSIVDFVKDNSFVIIGILVAVMGIVIYVIAHMLADSRKIQKLMYKDTNMDVWNLNYLTYWGEHKLLPERKQKYALVSLDLWKFRRYSVIYGWSAGEHLLENILEVLHRHVVDDTEICARNQGDRFALLLCYSEEEAFMLRLESLKEKVEKRIQKVTGDYMQLQMGIYYIPADEIDIRTGMNYANQALEFADSNEENGIKVYDESLQNQVKERHDRESLLESVNLDTDFVAFYQPKVDIRDGRIVGAEALVRFKDPTAGGAIKAPGFFVPYYEQTGKITELDMFVFEEVCKLLRKRLDAGLPVVTISCNFSRMHFIKPGFTERFEAILDKYDISKELIEVEITETLVVEELDHQIAKESFDELKARGIHLSIDDFGSGYSSLGIFEQVPASVVKMDRSFLLNQKNRDRQVKIMRGIINLSEELDAQVVCEGVETEHDVALMTEIGAFVAQGYYYSKPIPEDVFEERLDKGYMDK